MANGLSPIANARDRLIVALDFDTAAEAAGLVESLGDSTSFYKVGWRLFIREGMPFVSTLLNQGKRVFLDLKMGDIEETIRSALSNLPLSGSGAGTIEFLTIQGDVQTARAAKEGRRGEKPYLLVLTALSSQGEADVAGLLPVGTISRNDFVEWKARSALAAGCDGLIASGDSVRRLREVFEPEFGHFLIVTPGVRPSGDGADDHKNVLTPSQAVRNGADYLVIGRPIRNSPHPRQTAERIVEEIQRAMATR